MNKHEYTVETFIRIGETAHRRHRYYETEIADAALRADLRAGVQCKTWCGRDGGEIMLAGKAHAGKVCGNCWPKGSYARKVAEAALLGEGATDGR